ncbi:MAG: GNAT family N-acetyltransferase [Acidobacteriaceae bacterium]
MTRRIRPFIAAFDLSWDAVNSRHRLLSSRQIVPPTIITGRHSTMTSALQLDFLDLRHFSAQHLRPLLDEESSLWSTGLRWDYRNSASLVLQYVESHLLTGYVALDQGRVCGYIFCVYENHKAVIGDVFASREGVDEESAIAVELQLIERLLETLQHTPGLDRVEAQLLLHPHGLLGRPFEQAGFRLYSRLFMDLDLRNLEDIALPGSRPTARDDGVYREWKASDFDLAPRVITAAYASHIDSEINDQYLSDSGAQRFLHNIVRFPGCGIFEPQASWVLADPKGHRILGLLLCSRVSAGVGHVTQICVTPEFQGKGAGKKLMQLCAASLKARGCEAVTLTVTEQNLSAVGLYRRLGYKTEHRFDAMLWMRN